MHWSVYLLMVILVSCTTFSREKEQQSKIDSLTNELKRRDSAIKMQMDIKEDVQKDTVMSEVNDDKEKVADVKETLLKKKQQKDNSLVHEKVQDGKNDDSIREEPAKNELQENSAFIDERNAVLKKVVTEPPTFKPLLFGGFKDIKFNFSNRYPYKLDQVILKVHYIRDDGSEIKAETKILKDVAPNSRMTLSAPDHERSGKQLKVTVEAVQCRTIDLCFYRSEPAKSMDPYKCR